MKKTLLFLFVLSAALLLPLLGLAKEAEDVTAQCTITATRGKYRKLDRLYDRDYGTAYVSNKVKNPVIELTAPAKKPLYGLYVCFGDQLTAWTVEAKHGSKWEVVHTSEGKYAHEYVALKGEKAIRLMPAVSKAIAFTVSELFAFAKGDAPAYVQQWQPAPEKADLLVVSAHPDDEILFFGGAIPTYAGEKKMNVVVAYMTCNTMERRSELLNGLWEMGVRTYPVIGTFWDKYSKKLTTAYTYWNKTKTDQFLVELLRRYRPEVVLTHDVNGEYGHGAHRICADALQRCVQSAADKSKFSASEKTYGVWQVKKLYLHINKNNPIEMDWDQPLQAFGGRTGYQVAVDAYKLHASQYNKAGQKNPQTKKWEPFVVEPRESDYSCYRFGLVFTTVGPDTAKKDFFENVPGYGEKQ